jgi:putative membrane protein
MKLLFRWFAVALGFFVAAYFVPGVVVAGFGTAVLLAAFWGILGVLVRPILVLLTLPVTVLTFGLFIFVINAGLFWWLGNSIEGFAVDGFSAALLGSLVLTVVSAIVSWILGKAKDDD